MNKGERILNETFIKIEDKNEKNLEDNKDFQVGVIATETDPLEEELVDGDKEVAQEFVERELKAGKLKAEEPILEEAGEEDNLGGAQVDKENDLEKREKVGEYAKFEDNRETFENKDVFIEAGIFEDNEIVEVAMFCDETVEATEGNFNRKDENIEDINAQKDH